MMFIVFFLIFQIFLGYMMPKSKMFFLIELIISSIIIGGYNGIGDIDNYMYRYDNKIVTDGIAERLFDVIAVGFKEAGFSFEMFHLIISIIALSIIGYVIYKMSNKPTLAMALFFGYSTFEYALQIKALCAASIIIYAIYILLILIATGFHFMAPFFLMFLFINSININKMKRIIVPVTIGVAVFAKYIVSSLSGYIPTLSSYVDMHRSSIATIAFCVWQIISLIIVKKIMISNLSIENREEDKINLDTFVYKGSWLLILIMPFYSITFIVNRIVKIWSAFFYTQASNIEIKKGKLPFNIILIIIYSVGSFILFYFIGYKRKRL